MLKLQWVSIECDKKINRRNVLVTVPINGHQKHF